MSSWSSVGSGTSATVSGLTLTPGATYFASIRAVDGAGNVGPATNSDGWDVNFCADKSAATNPAAYGTGALGDPYRLCTAAQLNAIGSAPGLWGSHFKVETDIDLSSIPANHAIIGTSGSPFTGTFDGGGRTISGFTHIAPASGNVGLFGAVSGASAEIRDLTLTSVNVQGAQPTGGITGSLGAGLIINCHVQGTIEGTQFVGGISGSLYDAATVQDSTSSGTVRSAGGTSVGGIVGMSWANSGLPTIRNSTSSATIANTGAGSNYFAGIVGWNEGVVEDCSATGDITGPVGNAGGLVGNNSGPIRRSFATGSLPAGQALVGGLVGLNSGNGSIEDSYATGSVSGSTNVGGLVGNMNSATASVARCYATGSVTGNSSQVGGLVGLNVGTVSNSFSTGAVVGTTGAADVGPAIGTSTGTVTGAYFASNVSCTNSGGGGCNSMGTGIDLTVTPSYFQIRLNAPMTGVWDFTTVWQENSGALPTLR